VAGGASAAAASSRSRSIASRARRVTSSRSRAERPTTSIGRPIAIATGPDEMASVPRGSARRVPAIPTGSSGNPDRTASSAAPDLNGRSSSVRARLLGEDDERAARLEQRERRFDGREAAGPVSPVDRHEARRADRPAEDRDAEDALLRQEAHRQGKPRQQHQDVAEALVVGDHDEAAAPGQPLRMQDPHGDPGAEEDRPRPSARETQEPLSARGDEGRDDGGQAEQDRGTRDHDPDAGRPQPAPPLQVFTAPTFTRKQSEHTIGQLE